MVNNMLDIKSKFVTTGAVCSSQTGVCRMEPGRQPSSYRDVSDRRSTGEVSRR